MMHTLRHLTAVLVAAALLASSFAVSHAQVGPPAERLKEIQVKGEAFSQDAVPPAWVEVVPLPDADPTAPLSIRLFDTQYHIGEDSSVFVRRALTVRSASALSSAGQVEIHFVPEYQKAALHTLRIHRGTETIDRKANAMIRFLQREKDLEKGVYSGEVTASILVNDLRVGDTLEVAYSVQGQNPVFNRQVAEISVWDATAPTMLRRIVLTHPENRTINWRMIGATPSTSVTPSESRAEGKRRLEWQQAALRQIDQEPGIPAEHDPYRWLQISEFGSWNQLARWASGLFKLDDQNNAELRAAAERIRKLPTPEDRVEAALQFVQNEIRYFSVSLGESSHRPAQPDTVLTRRYGDCKDKSLLLIALLRQLDIEAKPVVLQAASRRRFDALLPSPQLFDHAIVQVPLKSGTYYLDPTRLGQHGRLSALGQIHEGAQVLVADERTDRLVTIASPNVRELARDEVIEMVELDKLGGEAKLTQTHSVRGAVAEYMRLTIDRVPREQLSRWLAEEIEKRYPGTRMTGEVDVKDDRRNNAVSITASYLVPKIAQEQNGNWSIRFTAPNLKGVLPPTPPTARKFPIAVPKYPYVAVYTFEARLPGNVSNVDDPRTQAVQGKPFSFNQSVTFRGNRFKATSTMEITATQIAPSEFAAYRNSVEQLHKTGAGGIYIPKSIIRSNVAGRKPAAADLGNRLAGQMRQIIDKTTQSIQAGKLRDKDLADAYCLRSESRSNLGMTEQAMADANAAITQSPESHSCRGYVHLFAGQFDKAIADYSKALSLGATEDAIKMRGIARFYAGAFEAARDDFAKAAQAHSRDNQVFADLWHAFALQRLSQPVPEELRNRAAADPTGEWPRPALAMATGIATPADVLKSMERKTGDELAMARSEGFFYIGQHYLAQKDTARAREYFEKARSQNVIIYLEHMAAQHELRQLGANVQTSSTNPPPAAKAAPRAQAKAPQRERARPESNDGWTSRAIGGQ